MIIIKSIISNVLLIWVELDLNLLNKVLNKVLNINLMNEEKEGRLSN